MIGDDNMRRSRLKKLADQSYMEFPIGMPFGEYNQNTPFDDTRIEQKEPFTKKTYGPKDNNSLWLFQAPLDNSEWRLQQAMKKNKK